MREFFFEDDCPYCNGKKMVDREEEEGNWVTYCLSCKKKIREDKETMLKILREMWMFYKQENIPKKLKQIEEVANVVKNGSMRAACQLYTKYNLSKVERNPIDFCIYIQKRKDKNKQ